MKHHQPKHFSFWRYKGPGDGRGEIHKVLETNPERVVTWTMSLKHIASPGHTWMGPVAQFNEQFDFVSYDPVE